MCIKEKDLLLSCGEHTVNDAYVCNDYTHTVKSNIKHFLKAGLLHISNSKDEFWVEFLAKNIHKIILHIKN